MKNSGILRQSGKLLLLLLWLVACTPRTPAIGTPTDHLPLHTPTSFPSQVNSPTQTPVPTKSSTPSPLPTLPHEQIIGNVVELLKTNAGCQLPCVWGITPGITSWVEAEQQLQKAGLMPASDRQGASLIHYDSLVIPSVTVAEGMFTKIEFIERNGVVTAIHLDGFGYYSPLEFKNIWDYYAPERIIPNLGSPTRVWIKAVASAAEGNPTSFPYELWLFYDKTGLLIRYFGTVEANAIYQFCPTFSDSGNIGDAIDIYGVSPTGDKSPEDLTELDAMPYPPRNLEEITNITIEELYLLYLQKDKPICFETPQDIWK